MNKNVLGVFLLIYLHGISATEFIEILFRVWQSGRVKIHITEKGASFMKLVIQGKNIEITEAIREYVNHKIDRAVTHFQALTTEVDVHLSVARNPRINPNQIAEVAIYANGTVIRAEESSENLYASIDLVADKIARQLRKFKEKRRDKNHVKADESLDHQPITPNLTRDRAVELPAHIVTGKQIGRAHV